MLKARLLTIRRAVVITLLVIVIFALIALTVSATQVAADDTTLNLKGVQAAIKEKGANWTAGETSVSGLSVEEKKKLCGAKIGPIPEDAVMLSPPEVSYGTFDWRNKDGQNWVTSVKNQGGCGSCWIFGSTAAFETQINIDANDPTIDFDASEQNILSCSEGGDCDLGGEPHLALFYIRDNGVPDEACLPYQADDTVPCSETCPDWQHRAGTCENIGVPAYHTTANYKAILENYGPMVVVLNAYEDLFYYTGGIYEPVWTSEEFGQANHCVMLVGYDDPNECWIIKNSWGPWWGENGYGRVYYGNLEQYEYAFVVLNTTAPGLPDIWVEPISINVTLPPDTIYSTNLTIGNDGNATLTYEITDTEGVSATQEPLSKKEHRGAGLTDLTKKVNFANGNIPSLEEVLAPGEEEIAYDDGEIDYYHWWSGAGGAFGVHFTSPTYTTLSTIRFYIYSNLTAFDWKVLSWTGSQPGSVIASGTTTPASSGWHDVDVGGITVPSDFVTAMYWKEANRPTLGSDGDPPIDSRSWDYNAVEWSPENTVDYMIRAVMSTEEGWLSESPTSGTVEHMTQTNITVTFNTTGLASDNYYATINITSNDPDENPYQVPVTLKVEEPDLCTDPDPPSHDFGEMREGEEKSWSFNITNCGDGELTWTVNVEEPWISINTANGSTRTEIDPVTVTINTTGLSVGRHTGNVSVDSSGGQRNGTITVTIVKPTILKAEPASQAVRSGQGFSVNVSVVNVMNMSADQATLNFNPTAMSVSGVTEGGFLKGGGTTWAPPGPGNEINNTAGYVTFSYLILTPVGGNVSGNGTLATIQFTTNQSMECTYDLNLTKVKLLNATIKEILIDEILNGTVILDNTSPNVEIVSPEEDEWFDSENVTVTFHPSDNKATTVNYTIMDNGKPSKSGTAPVCQNTTVDLGKLTECDHVIRVNVTDGIGKTNFSEVTIHVDLTPPTVQIIRPVQDKIYTRTCIKLNFTAEDMKSGINWSASAYNLDGENVTIEGNTTIWGLAPCNHSIMVYVKDKVGKGNHSEEVSFTVYPSDVDRSGIVDITDLLIVAWQAGPTEDLDMNCDDVIDITDLLTVAWDIGNSYT